MGCWGAWSTSVVTHQRHERFIAESSENEKKSETCARRAISCVILLLSMRGLVSSKMPRDWPGKSKAIAASQSAPDLVAFASELEGRVLSAAGEHRKAIRAYRVAQEEARPLDIARLNADIMLGLANLQLQLGDASSARNHAIEVMKIANENLLVLRQAKALLVVGKAAAAFGKNDLATSILTHAKKLARDSEFQWVWQDAEEALVSLNLGSGSQPEGDS